MRGPEPLRPEELLRRLDPRELEFETTDAVAAPQQEFGGSSA
jgi:hypothetical protein